MRLVVRHAVAVAALLICGCKEPKSIDGFSFEKLAKTTSRPEQERDGAVDLAFLPDGSGAYLLLYRDGLIEHRDPEHRVIATRKREVRQHNECGALAIEIDPDFAENRRVYVGFCVVDGDVDLRSFVWDPSKAELTDADTALILSWEKGVNDFHNLGDLGWDGANLWITYGDGNRSATSQDTLDLRGKLIRITPHRDGTPGYEVPADNPFVGDDAVADEVVVWGIKSSFRTFFFDGTWIMGEVGVDNWEELNVVTLNEPKPNLGFAECEGPFRMTEDFKVTTEPCDLEGEARYHPPDLLYRHDPEGKQVSEDPDGSGSSTLGFAITGGVYYRGDAYAGRMNGWYLYSDNRRDFVRRVRWEGGAFVEDQHFGHVESVWSWVVGPDGLIYALAPDQLYRLVPSG